MRAERFGPNTAAVDAMLERARELTEAEARQILTAHSATLRSPGHAFRDALGMVVHVARTAGESGRAEAMQQAKQVGRASVSVLSGTATGEAIAGYVGRLAEAIVVSDLVDP